MTRLSVNINKIATLRNARGGNTPNVLLSAERIQEFGADGITVHPRPDERHIRYSDVRDLKSKVHTEFNIEGYPNQGFLDLVKEIKPEQVTLVPDPPEVLTSNAGWNTLENESFLKSVIQEIQGNGSRVSLFMETDKAMILKAKELGTDRIELYTEAYASGYTENPEKAIAPFKEAAFYAHEIGLEINAGHDLNLENINYLVSQIPMIKEVSIGHALISEALYLGLENCVNMYKKALRVHETEL